MPAQGELTKPATEDPSYGFATEDLGGAGR
jgi:hypothetical protein